MSDYQWSLRLRVDHDQAVFPWSRHTTRINSISDHTDDAARTAVVGTAAGLGWVIFYCVDTELSASSPRTYPVG